jgi:hypothetical protein
MQLENFNDRKILDQFQREFGELAKKFAVAYGVQVTGNRATYQEKEVSISIKFRAEGVAASDISMAKLLGYPEIGTGFQHNGKGYEVKGYKFGRGKSRILTNNPTGGADLLWDAEPLKRYLISKNILK